MWEEEITKLLAQTEKNQNNAEIKIDVILVYVAVSFQK